MISKSINEILDKLAQTAIRLENAKHECVLARMIVIQAVGQLNELEEEWTKTKR